jgi:hypothetical protein
VRWLVSYALIVSGILSGISGILSGILSVIFVEG